MKTVNKIIIATAIVLIGLTGCNGKKADTKTVETKDSITSQLVKVTPLDLQNISRSVEFSSSLLANEEVHMVPTSPGKIDRILVEVGSRISQGQVLVQMDQTQLQQAKIQFHNLDIEFKRMQALKETGSISQQAYDQTKTQYEVAKTNIDYLERNTILKAPFSGVVSGKYFENGEMYSGSPNPSIGKAAIISLVQISTLKTFINIPESYFPLVKAGMAVQIKSEIYPDKNFNGKILRVYPTIDAVTHTFQAEITIPNAGEILRPGMFVRSTLNMGEVKALIAPYQAVLKTQGSNERYIFINDNGVAKRIVVALGQRFDDQVELISSEIKTGDEMVIAGQARLINGDKLNIAK